MKNRKDISRKQTVKMSQCDFMYTNVAAMIEVYRICDDF